MLRFAAAFAVVAYATACSRRSSFGGGGVTIGSPNIPAPPPPTPQPTPPPPPPPLPAGWQTPAFKDSMLPIQKQTRTNCKRRVDLVNVGTADSIEIEEIWVYTCSFNVYIQTEIAPTDSPQHCGCSLAYAREIDNSADEMYESAYKTEITEVKVVSFDPIRAVVNEVFPQFENFRLNTNLTNKLKDSAATASMDYTTAMASFSDLVEPVSEDEWPTSLDKSNPENTNNIAAFCFKVEEEYHTEYRWPLPPVPVLSQQPNSWQTNCIDWDFAFLPEGTAKRAVDPNAFVTKLWWREFMTFPTGDTFATVSGFNPQARLIRSYYTTSDCQTATAVASFDREFRYRLTHENVYDIHGAFAFFREFTSISVVGGAPKRFHSGTTMSFTGFVGIDWFEPYSRVDGNGAFRPGVVANALVGTPATGANKDMPFIGATPDTKLCQSVPSTWFACQNPAVCDGVDATNAYAENAFFYKLALVNDQVVITDAELDCAPAYKSCAEETTFLSAINTGLYGRDFTIRPESLLAVGPRADTLECAAYPTIPGFDSITFSAIQSGVELTKRGVGQLVEDAALPSHIKYMKRQGAIDRRLIVPPASAQSDPALGKPEVRDVTVQAGGGSADSDGLPAGDHPVRLFAETYAVPVSLDPEDIENDITHGRRVTGQAAPCIDGTQGCTCRSRRGRPRCDAPLTCSSTDAFPADVNQAPEEGFCQLPACLQGEAGCECTSDSGCLGESLKCESNTCVFEQRCTPGDNGCKCDEGSCSDGVCTNDNVCIAHDCPPGLPGCGCRNNENTNENYCFAEQGYKVPLTLVATEDHAGTGNDLTFSKGDKIIVTDRANIDPNGDGIWQGVLDGSTTLKEFPAAKVAVAPGASFEIVNAYECVADTICKNNELSKGELGGECLAGDSCNAGLTCDTANQVCKRDRCAPGSSGCSCNTDGTCSSGDDFCNSVGICVTPTCSAGQGGCACSLGRCEAGFECDMTLSGDEGRCVKERCAPGSRGCPCKQEANGEGSCVDDGFTCDSLKVDGTDKRCVAVGTDCRSQLARCNEFCGVGNVKDCPPCSHQVPVCLSESFGAASTVDSSASSFAVAFLAVIFAVAALL